LNADSKLRYPVNFSGNRREVYLEGEACFEITKDTLRPFVVHAAYTDIQVLGTLFNVSAYKAEEQTAVTLVNGKVEVSIGGKSNVLRPNEQYVLNHTTSEIKIRSVVASDYISWTQGLLCFDSMPLERLMMKLKRWYNISYEFKDQTLGNIRLTGGCHRGDDIHLIIEMLEELTDLTFTMEDQKVIIEKLKK
jgi:ferric-dicitrate binding protein FerR (iron transport regulator)